MTVVVVGDVVTDIVAVHSGRLAIGSDTDASITVTGGGAAANTAAWLAQLGVPVTLVAVVGEDPAGAARVEELRTAGVRCAVRRAAGAATGSIVVLSTGDDRTMLVDRGANGLLTTTDVASALAGARHVHVSGYTLFDQRTRPAGVAALRSAAAAGAATSVDAASAAPLRSVGGAAFMRWIRPTGLLFANIDEAVALLESPPDAAVSPSLGRRTPGIGRAVESAARLGGAVESAAQLGGAVESAAQLGGAVESAAQLGGAVESAAQLGGAVESAARLASSVESLAGRLARAVGGAVVVKRGAAGAVWSDGARSVAAPGEPATVVDPTGAGDAFAAGYLSRWLDGADPDACLTQAVALGARAVSRVGARP